MVQLRSALAFLAVAAMVAPALVSADADATSCPGHRYEAGTGWVCPQANGLLEVLAPDGTSLGFVHGQDPVREAAPALDVTPAMPTCAADTSTEYHSLVIYARATNDADRYNSVLPTIRTMVNRTNGHLREEGAMFGVPMNYRFACSAGLVEVRNEVLPTSMASASFSTIVNDLQAKGYTSRRIKFVVWYDDTGACGCAGQGHVHNDDSNSVNNLNNGAASAFATFGVTFGYSDYTTMMHEHGHNLGAVQLSSPQASGGWHCNDDQDIMCYDDGGPTSNYQSNVCSTERWDCNHDDYFHPSPAAGSYLATHWNLGSSLNRFIVRGNVAPLMQELSCSPVGPALGETVTCSFRASDDSSGVSYTVDWGDGAPTDRVPATGTVAPGATTTATHAYTVEAIRTVSVSSTDNDATPLTGAPLTFLVNAGAAGAPVMQSLSCAPNPATTDDSVSCTFRAADDSAGLYYTVSWGDGSASTRVPATGTVAPGTSQSASHTFPTAGTPTIAVTATDTSVPALTSTPLTQAMTVTLPPCNHDYSGSTRIGMLGNEDLLPLAYRNLATSTVTGIPLQCQGKPFQLRSTSFGADFDVCWYAGSVELACFRTGGDEEGLVPVGTNTAQVILHVGAQANWRLSLGD